MSKSHKRDDLEELLEEQVQFLHASCKAYDDGFIGEAKRIATVLRVLLSGSGGQSLFRQLDYEKFLMIDTCPDLEGVPGQIFQAGLSVPSLKGYVPRHSLPGNKAPFWASFSIWWDSPVIKTPNGNMSRREIVDLLANKEGGTHVAPRLDKKYKELKEKGAGFFLLDSGGNSTPMTKQEHACARQMAFEVLETIAAIRSGDAVEDPQDQRESVVHFPVFLLLDAEPTTKTSEIRVATSLNTKHQILPVFTNEEDAKSVLSETADDFQIHKLGKNGFVKFLDRVARPRGINYVCFDPKPQSQVSKSRLYPTRDLIEGLQVDHTDEEIIARLQSGEAKRI